MNSPPPCPNTVTVRRNPPRKARATPSTTHIPFPLRNTPSSSSIPQDIPSFPIQDILSIHVPENPKSDPPISESPSTNDPPLSENLKVFLRIRPLTPHHQNSDKYAKNASKSRSKIAWPQNPTAKTNSRAGKSKKMSEICISVNDSRSVTLCPPKALQDAKRIKSEVYQGFSHVFSADSSQDEVFAKMVNPLVDDFIKGKSGMLAALGPSGSGKTHTVFGSPREPGMVSLALRKIFSSTEGRKIELSRIFYLSMFEICSEGGKAERIIDLSEDVGDLSIQQSTIKRLHEVSISDVQQAESLIARGMLKRATAMTNSNSQSSRSQCIINIRSAPNKINEEVDLQSDSVVLTIVDLAGAEREKRTGNQVTHWRTRSCNKGKFMHFTNGARLLESNFINNTSMVFGLCLRSLLEHQKNPKKPLQKHFQSSLLTRYLRDYLEGKKRMALILTVKSGEEDYLDSSFLLRQASPYMQIKFNNVEQPLNSLCTKRHFQTLPRTEQLKRMKLTCLEACSTTGGKGTGEECEVDKEETLPQEVKEVKPQICSDHLATTINWEVNDGTSLEEGSTELAKERTNKIMQNFAKALWNVLKQYKGKLEVAENQIQSLRENLANEKARRSELETELKNLKSSLLCQKEVSLIKEDESDGNRSADQEACQPNNVDEKDDSLIKEDESCAKRSAEREGCQANNVDELNAVVSSLNLDESEHNASEQRSDNSDTNVNNFGVVIASSLAVETFEEQSCQCTDQECEGFPGSIDSGEDSKDLKDTGIDNVQFNGNASDSGSSESVVSSPKSLVVITNDSCSSVEGYQSHNDEYKKRLDQATMPEEDVELAPRCDVTSAPKSEPKLNSCCKPLNAEKPKRRLLPASSILLTNISSLDFEDENDKPKDPFLQWQMEELQLGGAKLCAKN
ncbi:kinesin-like protein KIN-6 isoform X2 [Camellia sinensis]|uniref:kinesin-like protein KIN-6 isoform X2 n=1 Tax=Camellia sinensis TaxID=4442 RepID=UPI001035E985|nr:kinesin-like protein KIN-6 isoform X2 [Camellia sinensis]